MSGINRQINGELAQTKSKGAAFVKALGAAFSPEKIAKTVPKTQPLSGGKKK